MKNKEWILLFLSVSICVAILYVRHPYAFTNPQFYAEDGRYFFADAYNNGWRSLFYRTNGYFHIFPRMIANASLSLSLPYQIIPTIFTYSCLMVYLLLWYYIFSRLPLPAIGKFFVVLSTMLVPLGNEILMNQTNIQWVMALFPVVIFCATKSEQKQEKILDWTILTFCVFTGPYILFLFPIFLLTAFRERNIQKHFVFLGVSLFAATACMVSLIVFGSVFRIEGSSIGPVFGFVQLFFYQYFFPILSIYIHNVSSISVIAFSGTLLAFLIALSIKVFRSGNRMALVSLISGFMFFLATAISYSRDPSVLEPLSWGIRNFYLPMVFLLWAIIAMITFQEVATIVWAIVFCWFTLQTVIFIKDSRAFSDMKWNEYAQKIGTLESLTIPINPPSWDMTLRRR